MVEFAIKQDSSYNFKDYNYKQNKDYIHLGLDCSGYIGWLLYNIFQDKGYVDFSRKIANNLATENKGKVKKAKYITEYKAGDIMSGENVSHVWLSLVNVLTEVLLSKMLIFCLLYDRLWHDKGVVLRFWCVL